MQADVREPAAQDALGGVDVLFHLAAALWRGRDGTDARRVNIEGTRNVASAQPGHLVLASSAAVYGAWPENPVPLDEDQTPRPNPECAYAAQKLAAERVAAEGAETSVMRIAAVLGPHMEPRLARAARGYRLAVPAIRGVRQALQFLHEDDAVDSLLAAGARRLPGVYNVATEDWLDEHGLAKAAGSRVVRLPRPIALTSAELAYRARLAPAGVDRAIFLTGPLALSTRRTTKTLGWTATRTSAATVRDLIH